jgi:thioredoxin-dependent peroxiredoxin
MLGKPVADFSLKSTGGNIFRLTDQRASKLVLCFYPKDNTPGCTQLGVSRDSLSDPEEKVCAQFGVMKDKLLYGRKVRGIERSTFVIDEKGRLAREWRGVKVPGHVEEVLNFAKAL